MSLPSTSRNAPKRKPPKLRRFSCPVDGCDHSEYKYRRMDIHIYNNHQCKFCGLRFFDVDLHQCDLHEEQEGAGNGLGPDNLNLGRFTESATSQGGIVKSFSYKNHERIFLVENFIEFLSDDIDKILQQCLRFFHSIKVQFTVGVYLIHEKNEHIISNSFNSPFCTLSHEAYIEEIIVNCTTYIIDSLNVLSQRGSGWTILRIDNLVITVAKNSPIRGGSSNTLRPSCLNHKRGLLDFQCPTDDCFIYAFLSALHHRELPPNRRKVWFEYNIFKKHYNFDSLVLPVSPSKLKAFEEANRVTVCLFSHDNADIYPMKINHNRFPKVALLLYTQSDSSAHYIAISNFNALVGESGVSAHFFCYYCFTRFTSDAACKIHMDQCAEYGEQIIEFPKVLPDGSPSYKEFTSFFKTYKLPFILCADLETTLEPLSAEEAGVLAGKGKQVEFRKKLECMAYGVVLCGYDGFYEYHSYCGENAMEKFLKKVLQLATFALSQQHVDKGFPTLTPQDWVLYRTATTCSCCKKNFVDNNLTKVFHHIHHTGKLADQPIICSICNLALKNRRFIPCLLHSAATLDFREICKGFHFPFITDIQVIPKSSQKFLSITLNKTVRFLDSYSHIPASLASLIEITKKSGMDKFKYTLKEFESFPGDISSVISKQCNPYDYFDSIQRLEETEIPPKSVFFNSLTESDISQEDYDRVKFMWEQLGCKTLGDYLSFYLKVDVFTLLDIVINFRDEAFDRYHLDMLQYLSGSSFSFDAALYNSGARFENMNDIDLLRTAQRACRGGVCHVATRHLESNLKGKENYKKHLPQKQILYQDFCSLYSFCMLQPLFMDQISKLTEEEITRLSANNFETLKNFRVPDQAMFVIVDLHTPQSCHERLKFLPLAPEKLCIKKSMLSEHQLEFIQDHPSYNLGSMTSERLILNFFDKTNYVVYLELLQYYVRLGMRIKKLHGGYKFRIKDQIKGYIKENLDERRKASDPISKNIVKNSLNSTYGFSLRAKQNDVNVKVARNPIDCERLVSDPRFRNLIQVKPNVTIILMKPIKAVFDLPYLMGVNILAISKLKLYHTVHGEFAELFHNRQFTLAMVDTDSILFSVTLNDNETSIYPVLKTKGYLFDFSVTPDPAYQDSSNYLVAGTLKDEFAEGDIKEVVVLNCKCYSIRPYGIQKDVVKMKGITRYKQRDYTFDIFKEVLMNELVTRCNMNLLISKNHQVYAVTMSKVSLSALNTKVFYIDKHGINSLPFGHYKIKRFYT